jgi:dTDP-4-dehydrorhamnose reductase
VLITGAKGQLGRALGRVMAGEALFPLDLPEHDIQDRRCVDEAFRAFGPDVVVHAAAHTNVDGCALDPDLAFRVNALGTRNVALACRAAGCAMAYVSTNEVFDGTKSEPYLEFDVPNPVNAYGRSKLAGEQFTRELAGRFYVVRTAWLYGLGGQNFITKILALADRDGRLRVVSNEIGSPTFCEDLAGALARLVRTEAYGTYHLVNEGAVSRFEYARSILDSTGRGSVETRPVPLSEFPRPSRVPPYTPLRNFVAAEMGIRLRPWNEALREMLALSPELRS